MIYFLLLFLIVVLGIFFQPLNIKISNKVCDGQTFYVVIIGIFLIALCGLRGTEIGNDTGMYRYIFESMSHLDWKEYWKEYHYWEVGYYFLQFAVSRFWGYQIFLIIAAVLSIGPVVFIIHRYSADKVFSFVLYVCFTYYTFCFSMLRQGIALGFIMLAYHQIRQRNLKCFLILTMAAVSFHTSALLFLPIYWIDKIPYQRITILFSAFLMMAAYIFKDNLWLIATRFARQQYQAGIDAGGERMYLFMILTVILGFIYCSRFKGLYGYNKVLLYMQIFSVMIWPMTTINPAVARMYYYYHIFFILYVPELLISIKGKTERFIISSGYLLVAIYFLVNQIFPKGMKIQPYLFFWQ